MKRYYVLFIIIIYIFLFSSCKKSFLDENQTNTYATSNTYSDSLGFEAGLAGLQAIVRTQYTYAGDQGLIGMWYLGTDEAIALATQSTGVMTDYYNYSSLNSSDGGASYYWNWAYSVITNANLIIHASEDSSVKFVSAANKKYLNAEARFYRAYAYNFLATLWGPVPLITDPIASARTNFTRTSLDSVNNQIITDLNFGIGTLYSPDSVAILKKQGRPNTDMARQLLAEVYLRTGNNTMAQTMCQAVINSKHYSLISNRYGIRSNSYGDAFSDMFIKGNERRSEGNTEAIWVIEQDITITGGSTGSDQHRRMWVPGYYNIGGMLLCDSLGGRGVGRIKLSQWAIYGLYDSYDIRNSVYSIHRQLYYNDPSSSLYGQAVKLTGNDTITKSCAYTTKWNYYNSTDVYGYGTYKDLIMMRLGETYLLLAEAQFKQGDLAGAASSINVLRKRAYKDYPTHGQISSSDITLDFILDERARELLAEENRRMTLVRTGTLLERVTNHADAGYVIGLKSYNSLLPLPQSEINLNKDAVLTQNLGY